MQLDPSHLDNPLLSIFFRTIAIAVPKDTQPAEVKEEDGTFLVRLPGGQHVAPAEAQLEAGKLMLAAADAMRLQDGKGAKYSRIAEVGVHYMGIMQAACPDAPDKCLADIFLALQESGASFPAPPPTD